ncbi:hypothetical protein GKC56_04015 [Neisseriaceae bacterium PsAf]|nr:hypothetical protein [Neisseriaceae bacterium PsAf]MCV2502823.1 hypothetical protein [Neisseriaceae bacterium]
MRRFSLLRLIIFSVSTLLISNVSIADETVYVWKSKGVNTYSDIPPTTGYNYGTVIDEDIIMMQKKVASQDNKQNNDDTNSSESTTVENQNTTSTASENKSEDAKNCSLAQNNLDLAQKVQDIATKNTLIKLYQANVDKYCH